MHVHSRSPFYCELDRFCKEQFAWWCFNQKQFACQNEGPKFSCVITSSYITENKICAYKYPQYDKNCRHFPKRVGRFDKNCQLLPLSQRLLPKKVGKPDVVLRGQSPFYSRQYPRPLGHRVSFNQQQGLHDGICLRNKAGSGYFAEHSALVP